MTIIILIVFGATISIISFLAGMTYAAALTHKKTLETAYMKLPYQEFQAFKNTFERIGLLKQ